MFASTQLQAASTSLGATLKDQTGFDFSSIFSLLIPMLFKLPCFQSEAQSPAAFLTARMNNKGEYRKMIVRRCRKKTQEAATQDGRGKLSDRELDLITKATFDKARQEPELAASLYTELEPEAALKAGLSA